MLEKFSYKYMYVSLFIYVNPMRVYALSAPTLPITHTFASKSRCLMLLLLRLKLVVLVLCHRQCGEDFSQPVCRVLPTRADVDFAN